MRGLVERCITQPEHGWSADDAGRRLTGEMSHDAMAHRSPTSSHRFPTPGKSASMNALMASTVTKLIS